MFVLQAYKACGIFVKYTDLKCIKGFRCPGNNGDHLNI